MSNGRSPRFEPLPQISEPTEIPKKTSISPIASLVGQNNMILVWTGLAILLFVVFIVFYLAFNPSDSEVECDESVNSTTSVDEIISSPKHTTIPTE